MCSVLAFHCLAIVHCIATWQAADALSEDLQRVAFLIDKVVSIANVKKLHCAGI